MNKRGQIYLLVALILALVLYMLMTKTNIIYEHEIVDDFETLSRNYDVEASRFMNSLLAENKEPKNEFDTFTSDFTKYAKNQNPDFSLIYVFAYEDKLYVGNYLKHPIIIENSYVLNNCLGGSVTSSSTQIGDVSWNVDSKGCILEIGEVLIELDIIIGSNSYKIKVSEDRPEIIIVSREEKGDQRKVYAEEEFVGSGEEAMSGSKFCEDQERREKNPNFCSVKEESNKFDCKIYNNFKDACEYDKKCCWVEESQTCKQGVCE